MLIWRPEEAVIASNESRQSLPAPLNQSEDGSLFPIKPLFFTAFGWWSRFAYASNENKYWRGIHSFIFYTKTLMVGWLHLSQWLMGRTPDVISMKWMTFIAFIPFKLTFRNWSRISPVYLKCDFTLRAKHPIVAQIENRILNNVGRDVSKLPSSLWKVFFLLKICIEWPLWSLCLWKQKCE